MRARPIRNLPVLRRKTATWLLVGWIALVGLAGVSAELWLRG